MKRISHNRYMTSIRALDNRNVSSFWQATEPGETNMAGAVAMTPEAAEKLAAAIRDAAKAARKKAKSDG